jgi:hypothetical protein
MCITYEYPNNDHRPSTHHSASSYGAPTTTKGALVVVVAVVADAVVADAVVAALVVRTNTKGEE